MSKSTNFKYFEHFLPKGTADYCFELWERHNFTLKIKPPRSTKLGDYQYNPVDRSHTITLNNDLNPYAFLITYLHEVAHLTTQLEFGRGVSPHGKEWKSSFRRLIQPVFEKKVLPHDLQQALVSYFKNPRASSCSDPKLTMTLGRYDRDRKGSVYLNSLQEGQRFILNERKFIKKKIRRTRSLCQELSTGRRYLISEVARVTKLD